MIKYLLLVTFMNVSIGGMATNASHFCTDDSSRKLVQFQNPGREVICTDLVLLNTTIVSLPNQIDELRDKKTIQLISVKGSIGKNILQLFPFTKTLVIYKSKIEAFSEPMFGALHVVESVFPAITAKTMTQESYLRTLGLHSNLGLVIVEGAFKKYPTLKDLVIYNQTFPYLSENFLKGLHVLEHLVLNRNNLTRVHDDAFKCLANLRSINLDHNPLESFTAKLHSLTRLTRVSLADTKMTRLGLRLFFPARSLTTLELPTTVFTELDVVELAIAFPNLRHVFVNLIEGNVTNLTAVLKKMEDAGLVAKDVEKSLLPKSSIFEGDLLE